MTKKTKLVLLGSLVVLLGAIALYVNLRPTNTVDPAVAQAAIESSRRSLDESPPPPEPPPVTTRNALERK